MVLLALFGCQSASKGVISFEQSCYVKKADGIYAYCLNLKNEKVVDGADVASFVPYDNGYGVDKNSVYYIGKKIDGADPTSFKALPQHIAGDTSDSGYGADKNTVYYDGEKIAGADASSFKVLPSLHMGDINEYGVDKNNVYYFGEKVEGVDVASFVYLGGVFAKDKSNVYVYDSRNGIVKIDDAQTDSFKLLTFQGTGEIEKLVTDGVVKEWASSYGADAFNVYYKHPFDDVIVVSAADQFSFKVTGYDDGEDKQNSYSGSVKVKQ